MRAPPSLSSQCHPDCSAECIRKIARVAPKIIIFANISDETAALQSLFVACALRLRREVAEESK